VPLLRDEGSGLLCPEETFSIITPHKRFIVRETTDIFEADA
jgi:hypothetical protein